MSGRARQDIEQIADYLTAQWSEQVKLNSLVTLTEKMTLIGQMPNLYKASRKQPDVRVCVEQQTALFYRITDTAVEIVTTRDTRQQPGKFQTRQPVIFEVI